LVLYSDISEVLVQFKLTFVWKLTQKYILKIDWLFFILEILWIIFN
jgi:hypothetical protein